jgi:flagellin-specific chaperone FliS
MSNAPDIRELERQLEELERLAEAIDEVPVAELPETLERTVELLRELNSTVDDRLSSAEQAVTELDTLLDGVDLESFDEALREQEER